MKKTKATNTPRRSRAKKEGATSGEMDTTDDGANTAGGVEEASMNIEAGEDEDWQIERGFFVESFRGCEVVL